MWQGRANSTADCGRSARAQLACLSLPSARPAEIAARSARRWPTLAAISAFMLSVLIRPVASRSSTWSPIATPMRKASPLPAGRKRPKGRFWIGKSQPASLAETTQLRSLGSWVVSMSYMVNLDGYGMDKAEAGPHRETPRNRLHEVRKQRGWDQFPGLNWSLRPAQQSA